MAEILLSSERFIKSVTSASDNLSGKHLLPALREAQEVGLRGIVGDCLLAKLKEVAASSDEEKAKPENAPYMDLIREAQYYLAYKTLVGVANSVTYKVGNIGVVKTTDENVQAVTQDDLAKQQFYYQAKADGACVTLQKWILNNKASFPELRACDCNAIRANLVSAATSGVFLGGPRGKKLPGGGGCCR